MQHINIEKNIVIEINKIKDKKVTQVSSKKQFVHYEKLLRYVTVSVDKKYLMFNI